MPLTASSRLARHEIAAALDAGGMGEVYRARGELPSYLEAPLDDLFRLFNDKGAKS